MSYKKVNYSIRIPRGRRIAGPAVSGILRFGYTLALEDSVKHVSRSFVLSAALLSLFLAAGCVSAPKEPEAAQAPAEADAGSSASTDADSGASTSD